MREISALRASNLVRTGSGFAVVSAIGLGIDVSIFFVLSRFQAPAGLANLCSAALAVTFVYFGSVRRIFRYQGEFLLGLFCVYLAYQVVAVGAASWFVHVLAAIWASPLTAKLAILPVTFTANYSMMRLITSHCR